MNRKIALPFALLLATFSLASCSGPKPGTIIPGGGGGGNASVSLSISDAPPANTALMSFTLPVLGVTLTPSGGGAQVSLFSSNPSANYELTRLQSDSDLIATNVSAAAGTYTAINVTVAGPSAVFVNSSGAQIGTCANGAICSIQGNAATITFSFPAGSPLVLTANQNQWLGLDFNYNNAIVTTNGIGIDVTQPSVLTALTTPPVNIPTGASANVDDFTGVVTAVSSSSITIQSTARGSLTASISSTITVNDPQGLCSGGGTLSCIRTGSVVSLQGVLTNTGLVNGTELDVIDASTTPADEVEGILYTTSCNGASTVGLILSDSAILAASSPLKSAGFGTNVCLTLAPVAIFAIDDGILTNQGVPLSGFTNSGDLVIGQTIRAKVSNALSGTNVINATASALILRFSRFTATVNSVTDPTFSISNLPVYFGPLGTPIVQTYPNGTIFEGVTGVANLQNPQTVSISALYLNPAISLQPFQAAKIRVP